MPKKRDGRSDELSELKLPRGVKLSRILKGHKGIIWDIAFDPTGKMLASMSADNTVKLWDVDSGKLLRTLDEEGGIAFDPGSGMLATFADSYHTVKLLEVDSGKLLHAFQMNKKSRGVKLAFNPLGRMLASGNSDGTIMMWDIDSSKLLYQRKGHVGAVFTVAFDSTGQTLASGGGDGLIRLRDADSGMLLHTMEGHKGLVRSITFNPANRTLASGSDDNTIKLWDVSSGKLLRTLEGHTRHVDGVSFSADGQLLASKSGDGTLRLWSPKNWETVAVIPEPAIANHLIPSVAFHPTLPLLASVGSKSGAPEHERACLIHIWELNLHALLSATSKSRQTVEAVHHTTAKIVLVGDSGVGKTGLGWRLAHGEFKEHASTHGQQFWVVDELGTRRKDGTECEAIVWDLAGQPDYRLTHALFLDDADLALVLFDPTDSRDPLHGVEFWLKQLRSGRKKEGEEKGSCPTILVGARADRGDARLTKEELDEFCRQRGISGGYLATSASVGTGLKELLRRMKVQVAWEQKATTVTTVTFKRIKDYVLGLKENRRRRKVIVSPQELRKRLEKIDKAWEFTDAEMMTAVGHLANYGYVRVLRTSKGEERVLLSPELLNNLAASFVLEARRNPKGLGSLEEVRLLAGEYQFRELEKLSEEERDILLDSAALLFLEHNVCFRETDPLGGQSYLVFPELINLKKPLLEEEQATEDGAAYTVSGAVENVYASLVVLLGYTQTFTRTDQWRSHARYEVGDRLICGFRQEAERDGELDFVLYFGTNVGRPVRTLFQGLFESFLARRNLSVFRYEPVACSNGHALNRGVVREQLGKGNVSAFCPECGGRVVLPKADEPIQLTQTEQRKVDEQQWFAARRSLFEQAVFQVVSYVKDQEFDAPECFISYAWGEREHERWVERNLATDLQKAGIRIVLDRWENDRGGKSVSRFVSRIAKCDVVIPVGTPLYFRKFENRVSSTGSVVASEVDLISQRLMGTEEEKETVVPILLAGAKKTSLPPLMWDRVHRDFHNERAYFITAFDLILDLYKIAPSDPAVADLRESLRESDSPLEGVRGGRVR